MEPPKNPHELQKLPVDAEERRNWSGLSEWQDPLEKERPKPEEDPRPGMASLAFGIAAMCTLCAVLPSAILGVLAIVFGIRALRQDKGGLGAAKIGIVLGIIAIGVGIVLLGMKGIHALFGDMISGRLPDANPEAQ